MRSAKSRTAGLLAAVAGAALGLAPAAAFAATLPLVTSWGGAPSTAPGQFNLLEDVSVGPTGDVFTIENGGSGTNPAGDRVQRFSGSGVPLQPPFGSEGPGRDRGSSRCRSWSARHPRFSWRTLSTARSPASMPRA